MAQILSFIAATLLTYPVQVIGCYDGDTCTVNITLEDATTDLGFGITRQSKVVMQKQQVRLCDLDAPEMPGPDGVRSRDALIGWLRAAKKVELRLAAHSSDKYGRWLGWLIADGVDINARLQTEKLAEPYLKCK